jgi:4-coumarate--CoA ligase (photoactive yellow protein activation family)
MAKLISQEALERLWKEKLMRLAPRLKYQKGDLLALHFKDDLALDSVEILDLYSSFMDLFALQLKADEQTYLYQYQTAKECIEAILKHVEKAEYLHFKSSGSSDKPHGHLHGVNTLIAERNFWAGLWQDCKAVYYCANGLHIYGFIMAFLVPSKLKIPAQYFSPLDWNSVVQDMPEKSLIIAFPEAIEHIPIGLKFPKNLRLVSSTAPLRPALQNRILEAGLELYKVYGSTETAGIAYAKNESPVYQLLPFWSAAKMTLTNRLNGKEEKFPDHIYWQSDSEFTLGTRVDEVIQIAGHNISLPEICQKIQAAFPHLIKDIWIRKMSLEEGRRLKAWLQIEHLSNLREENKAEIYQWIEDHLPPEARPKHLTFSADKALNPFGKLTDWPIHD